MGINGNDVLKGYIDPPEVAAILRAIHSLDVERLKLYGSAEQDGYLAPRSDRRKRLREIELEVGTLWAAIRRVRFAATEKAA